ncbi:molybdenum cofactor guanylyltransferase MobA [Pseudomonas sp.]|uniref:molybdenum cofactor guanylyltransferase MobA n=1 Tax=Pseudomonas sp. TaxID=306 RepID=UPI003D1023CB
MLDYRLPSCSILLLAGGRGQRMGGQDKGLIEWHGRPLIAWLHDLTRPMTDQLLLSCNRNQERYAAYADRLVSDEEADYPGPLAGIRAGLAVAHNPWLLVLPCDTPLLDRPLLQAMYSAAASTPGRPLMLRSGKQWEPLFSLIPTHLSGALETHWLAGERSVQRLLLQLGAHGLELKENDHRLANLNTPELLERTARQMGT